MPKISDLNALSSGQVARDDRLVLVDVSDTSEASTGRTVRADVAALAEAVGAFPPVEYVEGFSAGQAYSRGSDVLAGLSAWTLAFLFSPRASSFAGARYLFGTEDQFGSGGAGVVIDGEALTARFWDNGGTLRQIFGTVAPLTRKWAFGALVYDATGADTSARLYVNGARVESYYGGGVSGAISGGSSLALGGREAVDQPADQDRIHGAGWVNRAVTPQETGEWFEAVAEAGRLVDIPSGGGLSEGWRVSGSEPGALWAPFVGAASLTRTGSALSHGTARRILWK